jgi:hypothetical protein
MAQGLADRALADRALADRALADRALADRAPPDRAGYRRDTVVGSMAAGSALWPLR